MKTSYFLLLFFAASMTSFAQGVEATTGKITLLRVHDVGTKYGPPADQIDTEVIIKISSKPGNAFGFRLRKDDNQVTHEAMLELLQDAFNNNKEIRIEFRTNGTKKNLYLFRVIAEAPGGMM
jgi:hypothetical protein